MDALFSLNSPSSCPHLYLPPSYPGNNASLAPTATTAASFLSRVIVAHYNHTGRLQHRTASSSHRWGAGEVVSLLIAVLIILENLVVLAAILSCVRHSRRWLYVCLANITLSDLLAGAAYVVNVCLSGGRTFRLSPALWLFREGVLFVALAASVFSLLLIAVERYAAMTAGPRRSPPGSSCRIYGLAALCWALALAVGFLPLLGWNCVCSLESCSTLLPLYSKSYILFSLVLFLLILVAIGVLYGAIYWHVRGGVGGTAAAGSGQPPVGRRTVKLLKTVVSIVGVFVLCWGPLFLLLLVDFFCVSRRCAPLRYGGWFIALAVLNSALNPVLYSLGSPKLRQAIGALLCCYCCRRPDRRALSRETSSTSESRHSSARNSFGKTRSCSVTVAPPGAGLLQGAPSPSGKKSRLSSTTTCLSWSSG